MKKRLILVAAIAAIALVAAACTSNDSSSSSGAPSSGGAPIDITMWHGYGKVIDNQGQTNYEAKSLTDLVDQYNAMNTGVHVTLDYIGSNDNAYQKLTVALQGGLQPDITYQYGTSMAAARDRAQHHGPHRPRAGPGVQLGRLLGRGARGRHGRRAGLRSAGADRQPGDRLQQGPVRGGGRGSSRPPIGPGTTSAPRPRRSPTRRSSSTGSRSRSTRTEDTVWHYDAMLWEAGGDILNADNTEAAFNSPAGVEALTTLQEMAVTDKSVFLDQQNVGKIDDLFNAGKIAMDVTGPWALSGYPDINYGVQIMPMFDGGSHTTIAGPDMWVLFDNGDGARRRGLAVHAVVHRSRAGQGRLDDERAPADP